MEEKWWISRSTKEETVSELRVALKKIWQFSTGSINKANPSFRNSLTRVREGWWKTFWAFFSTQKSVHTYGVSTTVSVVEKTDFQSWVAETNFDNVSTAKLPWLKAA